MKDFKFESAMKELEAITEWFERPDVELDQSLAKFERGLELSNALKTHLEEVENKVQKIKQKFDTPLRPALTEPDFSDEQSDLFA
jgi:exodeoxyribonuclease VII small subunit